METSLEIEPILRDFLDKEPPMLRRDMSEAEVDVAEREIEELLIKQRGILNSLRDLRQQFGADPADLKVLDKLLSLI